MRKRTFEITTRMTRAEKTALEEKVRMARFPRETFCRWVLAGKRITEMPSTEFNLMWRDTTRIKYNLNQLLMIAQEKNPLVASEIETLLNDPGTDSHLFLETYCPE